MNMTTKKVRGDLSRLSADKGGHGTGVGNEKGSVTILILFVLGLIYFGALFISFRGWGYPGYYRGYYGPSWFYWGGPSIYHSPSVRTGSVGGPSHRGGGLGGGK